MECKSSAASSLLNLVLPLSAVLNNTGGCRAYIPGVDGAQGEFTHVDLLPCAVLLPGLDL